MRMSTRRSYRERTKQIMELKNTITELKNLLERFNTFDSTHCTFDQTEEIIANSKTDYFMLLSQRNKNKKGIKKSEGSLRYL